MLKGDDLIAMVKILGELAEKTTKLELIRECGYIIENEDGSKEIHAKEFTRALTDAVEGPSTSNNKEELLKEQNEAVDCWEYKMLGGEDELDRVIEYGLLAESPLIKVLEEESENDDLRFSAVTLARLRRAYELETNRPKLLNDFKVQGLNPWFVADYKYQFRYDEDADDSELLQYAITEGNEFADPQLPELLSFFPSHQSVSAVFESLRDLLEKKKLQITPGIVIEITGILGLLGEVPIRISLLNETQLKLAHENFYSGRSIDYPIILVDIPDLNGCFAWEQGAQDYVCKNFQNDYLPCIPSAGVTEFDAPCSAAKPNSVTDLYDCLRCYIESSLIPASQDGEVDDNADEEEDESPPSTATICVLLNLLDDMDPDSWDYEGTPEENAKEHIENCFYNIRTYLLPKLAREYVLNESLVGYDEDEPTAYEARKWRLPPPAEIPADIAHKYPPVNEWGDFYTSKQELLLDVDWEQIKSILEAAIEDSIDPDEVEICRKINARRKEDV
jgi:hypothetical protein